MKCFIACLTITLLGWAASAQGQTPVNWPGYGVPYQQYGFGGPVAGHHLHASTSYEGMCRGIAAVTQARAQYNLLTSLAMLNVAQAQRLRQEANYWQQRAALEKQREKQQARQAQRPAARRAAGEDAKGETPQGQAARLARGPARR